MGQTFISFFVPLVCCISVISLLNLIFSSGSDKVYMLHLSSCGLIQCDSKSTSLSHCLCNPFQNPFTGPGKWYNGTGKYYTLQVVSLASPSSGTERHPFVSVLREECVWVWWCLPEAQKPDGLCKRRALTQLSCLLFSRYLIYYSMTWTWLSTKAESRISFRAGTQIHVIPKEKKLKWHLKSEVQQDNISSHTHWAGLATISLIGNEHSNTLAAGTVGCWSKTSELCEIQS